MHVGGFWEMHIQVPVLGASCCHAKGRAFVSHGLAASLGSEIGYTRQLKAVYLFRRALSPLDSTGKTPGTPRSVK
jgi:hypothetical protein